jgi:molybdopterin converting factor small subunit
MGTRAYMLPKAAAIFQETEQCFKGQDWIEKEWMEEKIKKMGITLFPTFFRAFLVQEQILVETSQDEKTLQALQRRLAKIPQSYRRALEVYFNERLAVRERQLKLNAQRPITLRTLLSDLDTLSRLGRMADRGIARSDGVGYGARRTHPCVSSDPGAKDQRAAAERFVALFPTGEKAKADYPCPAHGASGKRRTANG